MNRSAYLVFFIFCWFINFNVLAQPLTLVYPKNGTVLNGNPLFMQWNDYPGATSYRIQLASDPNFTLNLQEDQTTVSNFSISGITEGEWYWRVIAEISVSEFLTSNSFNFKIFHPEDQASVSLWLKADSGIVLDGSNKVSSWTDLSQTGGSFVQIDPTKKTRFYR